MPCLTIFTNLPKSKIPEDFVDKILPVLSACVKKPVQTFICMVSGDCQLSINGDSKMPAAIASLESIGNLGLEENDSIAKDITAFLEKELRIHPQRFFLSFYDKTDQDIAKGGSTIAKTLDI